MEDEMSIPSQSSDLNYNIEHVVKLVETLYSSNNSNDQSEANRRLTELQSSDNVWTICWPLLDPNQCTKFEVNFFAANTLVLKINQSWAKQDEDWLENHLRPKIFETLVNYASSPSSDRLVVERLALALATFALHSIPTFWPNAIEDILQTFTPQNLPATISPQRVCDILLKILMYIPEEYSVLMPQQEHRAKLNGQMNKSGPIVFKFLHSLLLADKSAVSTDCRQSVLKCLTSWTMHSQTSLLEMDDGKTLLNFLHELIIDEDLCSSACATLAATFSTQKAESYQNAILDFIPKIAQLKPIIEKYTKNDEIECAIKIYSLVINFSENHARFFLKLVLNDGITLENDRAETTRQAIFTIIRTILDCTSAPGVYGIDEKYSDISFAFWFTFFENFYYYQESFYDLICKTFDPLVDSLLQILITKSQYPPSITYYQTWNDDQRESYRCYRQDLGDNISLIAHFPRSRDRILERLHSQLDHELNLMIHGEPKNGEIVWQGFESIIFALKSIAESIPYDEAEYVPKIFTILSRVPFNESQALLYCTAAEMISAYSDWLYSHNCHLATAFNILFLGINSSNSHVRLMSTLSLKDITFECQPVLQPFALQIVRSCTVAVLEPDSSLSTNEKARLMHTIGTTLVMSPQDSVMSSLDSLTLPLLCDLNTKLQCDSNIDPTCRAVILDRLTMLNSLIESLYVKQYSGNEYEGEGDENASPAVDLARYEENQDVDTTQPVLGLLNKLIPILNIISIKYQSDEDIMNIISNTIKRSAKSLGTEVKPILQELLSIIVNAYNPLLNSNILDGTIPLYMLFTTDTILKPLFKDAFARISGKTLEVCLGVPLSQLSVTIENYFKYATMVCKRSPDFFTDKVSPINMEYIHKLAVACLELPERRTLAEVCNFLCQFRNRSLGVEHLYCIFVNHLDVMLGNIFNILGGNYSTPRNAIDHVTDLLFTIASADEIKAPLKVIVEKENFPTTFVTRDQKERFVSKILHEKNRRRFKEACSEFVLIVRNLNRAM